MSKLKVLITGISGFVGSYLSNALKKSYDIYGLDIVKLQSKDIINIFSWNDLDSPSENFPNFDIIIHLAGKAHDTTNKSLAKDYFEVNTQLTEKIYNFFLSSTATRFIFFSSVKAAADVVPGDILTEEVIPQPVGPYGESKIKAEEYILNNLPLSRNIYLLRPCMIHGPGNKGNLNLLYQIVSKGIPWPLGKFENQRSFLSIDNLSFLIENILEKNIPSGIYNLADDEAISTNELIRIICESMNKKSRIIRFPKLLMERFADIGNLLHLPLNKQRLEKLTENYVVSNEKIKKAIGIKKLPVKAQDGFKKTIKSFVNENN